MSRKTESAMKMKHRLLNLLVWSAALVAGCGCQVDEGNLMAAGTFEIDGDYLSYSFTQAQEIVFIPVRTNVPEDEWKITSSDDSWCKASRSYTNETGIQLAVTASDEPEVRKASVQISAAGKSYGIEVRQLGYGPAILVTDKTVPAAGGDVEISVVANIDFTVGAPVIESSDEEGWIKTLSLPPVKSFAESAYAFNCEANTTAFRRRASIAVNAVDPMYWQYSETCTITQETHNVTTSDIPSDIQVMALSANANQAHSGNGAELLIDGDLSTNYHSPWQPPFDNPTTQFPVILDFTFDGTHGIDYIVLYSNNGGNGLVGKFDVYYKSAGDTEYTAVNTEDNPFDFGKTGGTQRAYFPQRLENITDLRLSIREGSGAGSDTDGNVWDGFVSAFEIEFYEMSSSSLNEAILNVFTDLSCSELKPRATRTEISALYALSPFIAQKAAVSLLENTYDEFEYGFRAQSYAPYSDININSTLLTKRYSRMDNPTGIEVKAGDQLIVCVDKIPSGQSVSLAVYGKDADGYGPKYSSADQETTLTAGVNSINVSAPGMLYVMNTARTLSAASQPVKVHILPTCGNVQGYFDLERHKTDEKYRELLARTTYEYFVAKGRKLIFNVHTSQLRTDSPNSILSGLEAWDELVSWQHELMGLNDCSYFNNHIMAVTSTNPTVYMNASEYRVQFAASALYKIISREQLNAEEDNTWGPAHEVGHVNQGAINWKSTTESSNNLFSNYSIYKMGIYGSRGSVLSELAASYASRSSWVLLGEANYQSENTELHMRMNWQLWNYYHRCGFKTDFWPTLFQILRDDPLPSEFSTNEDPGASQLKFAVAACKAAQEDLTEFFETWGFFRTVDMTYEQYGTARYRITEDMIAAAKAEIAALGYPKAAPIQYIEDRKVKDNVTYCDMGYYTTFQNKTKITKKASYTAVSDRSFTVSNCDEAVAVEVRKAASGDTLGELLYFSNMASFTLPANVETSNISLYLVQYDGERILINK